MTFVYFNGSFTYTSLDGVGGGFVIVGFPPPRDLLISLSVSFECCCGRCVGIMDGVTAAENEFRLTKEVVLRRADMFSGWVLVLR